MTVVEVVVATVVGVVVMGFLFVANGAGGRRCGCGGRQIKDGTQVRNIVQSMYTFSSSNADRFPLPSELDKVDATVALSGEAKNTTGNIIAILIQGGGILPEMAYSPAEQSPSIRIMEDYAASDPVGAVRPAQALWDPRFSADFTAPGGGNLSYAVGEVSGTSDAGRRSMWTATASALRPIVGNRAPLITTVDPTGKQAPTQRPGSNTLMIHGGRKTWEGNIAYADGHVEFHTTLQPLDGPNYARVGGKQGIDCPYFDETDDASGRNTFLGIFIKAGNKPGDFVGIWD